MKVSYVSDVHTEFNGMNVPECDSEVVILAGDIGVGTGGVNWVISQFQHNPNVKLVIYVLGNHEYYHHDETLVATLKQITEGTKVCILDNEYISYQGVRFIGSTLWTDFNYDGRGPINVNSCQSSINCFRRIRYNGRRITPQDMISLYNQSVYSIREHLSSEERNVVITHFPPIKMSPYNNNITSYFSNRLEDLILDNDIVYWIYGHDHFTNETVIGNTVVTSAQRGYDSSFMMKDLII